MGESVKQLCTIRILFPVDSDDQAVEYKKKISGLIAEIPDAQIQFTLMTQPRSVPSGSPVQ